MNDTIADALNTQPMQLTRAEKHHSVVPRDEESFDMVVSDNKIKDYTKVRDNLINIIDETELVVEAAADEVKTNPSARMFETFATLIRTYADINKDLLEISGGVRSSKNQGTKDSGQTGQPVNNLVFVGTSDSLIDTIRNTVK